MADVLINVCPESREVLGNTPLPPVSTSPPSSSQTARLRLQNVQCTGPPGVLVVTGAAGALDDAAVQS